jgi:hypothetical protein
MNVIKYSPKKFAERYVEVWGARSTSRPDKIYTVALNKKDEWSCGCPRWTMNASRPDCKHIKFIKQFREKGFQATEEAEVPEQVEKALTRFSAVEV